MMDGHATDAATSFAIAKHAWIAALWMPTGSTNQGVRKFRTNAETAFGPSGNRIPADEAKPGRSRIDGD